LAAAVSVDKSKVFKRVRERENVINMLQSAEKEARMQLIKSRMRYGDLVAKTYKPKVSNNKREEIIL